MTVQVLQVGVKVHPTNCGYLTIDQQLAAAGISQVLMWMTAAAAILVSLEAGGGGVEVSLGKGGGVSLRVGGG